MASFEAAEGVNGQPCVRLRHSAISWCEIHLHGATITRAVLDSNEVVFVSEQAVFDGSKAIRGGIPVVFPQFGQPLASMPSHGVARTQPWEVVRVSLPPDSSSASVTLGLGDNEWTRSVFPFAFRLEYEVVISPSSLSCRLRALNNGSEPFACHALLHTYYRISSINNVEVSGLGGCTYNDKVTGVEGVADTRPVITIDQETDSVYTNATQPIPDVTVLDKGTGLVITLNKTAYKLTSSEEPIPLPCDTVLWNPWIAKAARLADLGDDEYGKFVCVEPGVVSDWVQLLPNDTLELSQLITISRAAA